jgi:outer membrane protein assembly factor BamA
LPDYLSGEKYTDSTFHISPFKNYIAEYHRKLFKFSLLDRNLSVKKGSVFRQDDYFKTINDLYKLGVWESPTIDIIEQKDTNLLNLVVKLVPLKRYAFEGNIEMSYSANNATNAITTSGTGNLLGLSVNLSVTDRNLAKSAIRMTNGIKAGVELIRRIGTVTEHLSIQMN